MVDIGHKNSLIAFLFLQSFCSWQPGGIEPGVDGVVAMLSSPMLAEEKLTIEELKSSSYLC